MSEPSFEEMWAAIKAVHPDAQDIHWEPEGWHGIMIGGVEDGDFIHDDEEPFDSEESAVRDAYQRLIKAGYPNKEQG